MNLRRYAAAVPLAAAVVSLNACQLSAPPADPQRAAGQIAAAPSAAAPSAAPSSAPASSSAAPFDAAEVARGRDLAMIGNCISCHSAAGGRSYAGGGPIRTPAGTLYATNITPDDETGIGRWSAADFRRAMQEGIARDGRRLFPVFPYDHFARLRSDDLSALYAFFMTREPVRATAPADELAFPFGARGLLGAWNALYLDDSPWRDDPARSAQWNRGAYLAETLAHCGACHTPRNLLLAEDRRRAFAGAEVEGWEAPPLKGPAAGPRPWTGDELFDYLRRGGNDAHGSAAGPMLEVTRNLGQAPESDVRAIAVYVASLMDAADAAAAEPADADDTAQRRGATLFAGACAGCHGADAPRTLAGRPPLALTTSVNAASPRNAIQFVLHGMQRPPGERGSYMPGFDAMLTDDQVAAVLAYVRARYSPRPAWRDLPAQVARIRDGG